MDVYKFIRSKDVREYNEKLGHKFNALESCFLVWRNPDLTLNEKHEAWRHICLEMPGMEIKERLNVDYHPSLYELIEKFVATDKFFINEFYREEDKAVYQYRFYSEGDHSWCEDFETPYSSFEKMEQALEEDFDLPIIAIEYKKKYLDSEWKDIVLSLKKDGTIMNVRKQGFANCFMEENHLYDKEEFFEGLFIDIPTPFKVGDIVCSKRTPFCFSYKVANNEQPFVLTWMANWTYEMSKERGDKKAGEWQDKLLDNHKKSGDATDMTANGYFLITDYHDRYTGEFYHECMHDYADLEYYRGDFKGGERVLIAISDFIKGEIDADTFAKVCEIIKKQESIKEEISCLNMLDEWLEKVGLK